MNALYIHIPFCSNICSYCDFYKMIAKEGIKQKYIDYLIKELLLKQRYLKNIKTIYIGGGTPSSLNLELLEKLFIALHDNINFNDIEEFTIESNPLDITDELVNLFNKYGINRVSLGVQSIDEDKLKILNRQHSIKNVKEAFRILKENNINNINADIIYGVGDENYQKTKKDILFCIKNGATHISTYSLILEQKTLLYHLYKNNQFKPMDEDKESHIFHKIRKLFNSLNFNHYELSNFSKPNFESKHNQIYWNNLNYLGIGASASYYIDNVRYTNIMNLESYFTGIDNKNLNHSEMIKLDKNDMMKEEFILGLRMLKGVNVMDFKNKYNEDPFDIFPFIKKLIDQDLLIFNNNHLFIPVDKLYISNSILVNFI